MLNPPIAAIRRGLFDPPDAAERDGVDVTAGAEVSSTQPVPEIPTWLLSQIDQIVASRAVLNADAVVAIGDIRQIATVRDGDGNHIRTLDWPVAILVTSYTTDGSTGTAQGFCVASESLYCGPQDVLLQEPDGPFDPSAVMVQLWNRMDACIDAKAPLLGRLPQSSVDELKLLAKLPKKAWPATTAVPGKFGLAVVTAPKGDEFEIVTGTPLGEADDVRWIYRSIYRQLASELAEHLKPHQESAGDSPGMSGMPPPALAQQKIQLNRPLWAGFAALAIAVGIGNIVVLKQQDESAYRGGEVVRPQVGRYTFRVFVKRDTVLTDLLILLRQTNATLDGGPDNEGALTLSVANTAKAEALKRLEQSPLIERVDAR